MVGFSDVKKILDDAITGWSTANGNQLPQLVQAHKDPSFGWATKAALLSAKARGVQLIQKEVRGNGKGDQANLVVALSSPNGVINPANGKGFGRMPDGGPYLDTTAAGPIAKIIAWIDADCPD